MKKYIKPVLFYSTKPEKLNLASFCVIYQFGSFSKRGYMYIYCITQDYIT